MSANVVRDFLPGVQSFVGDTLWTVVFPPRVEQLCPRPQISLNVPSWLHLDKEEPTLTLMWPAASICCLLGIVIGFSYGVPLLYKAMVSNAQKGTFTWACAFLWYGLMSLGGLFFHCISQRKPFYFLDLVSTACACVSLLAIYRRSEDRSTQSRNSFVFIYCMIACLAIVGGHTIRNFLYLGPASLSFILGGHFAIKAKKGNYGSFFLGCACASAFMAIAAVLLDRFFCDIVGSNFSLLFWFFLGSDLAMLFLFHFTLATSYSDNVSNHHSPPKSKFS